MSIALRHSLANAKSQFVLPDFPEAISPELGQIIAQYRAGFSSTDEDDTSWNDAARQCAAFDPRSTCDLAAKLILAIHFRDPEIDGNRLAIEAPSTCSDRLAIEMELSCLDELLSIASASANCRVSGEA